MEKEASLKERLLTTKPMGCFQSLRREAEKETTERIKLDCEYYVCE